MDAVARAQTKQEKLDTFAQFKVGARRVYELVMSEKDHQGYMQNRQMASNGDETAEKRIIELVNDVQTDIGYLLKDS